MCCLYDNCVGVSDVWVVGFGEEFDVFILFGIGQEVLLVFWGCMFGNFVKGQFIEGFNGVGCFDKVVGGFGVFGNEDI